MAKILNLSFLLASICCFGCNADAQKRRNRGDLVGFETCSMRTRNYILQTKTVRLTIQTSMQTNTQLAPKLCKTFRQRKKTSRKKVVSENRSRACHRNERPPKDVVVLLQRLCVSIVMTRAKTQRRVRRLGEKNAAAD